MKLLVGICRTQSRINKRTKGSETIDTLPYGGRGSFEITQGINLVGVLIPIHLISPNQLNAFLGLLDVFKNAYEFSLLVVRPPSFVVLVAIAAV